MNREFAFTDLELPQIGIRKIHLAQPDNKVVYFPYYQLINSIMKIKTSVKIDSADMLIIPVYKSKTIIADIKKYLSKENLQEMAGTLNRQIFNGNLGQTLLLHNPKNAKHKSIIILGLGEEKNKSKHKIKKAGANLAPLIEKTKSKKITIINTCNDEGIWIGAAAYLKIYKFDRYITNPRRKGHKISEIIISDKNTKNLASKAIEMTNMLEATIYTRNLINRTSNDMGPTKMAEEAKTVAKEFKNMKITILDRSKLEKMGMGAIMAIGKSSNDGPYIVTLEYKNEPNPDQKPIAIVGKGVTFDSGGLILKPAGHIENMHLDKTGACTVLSVIRYLAKTNFKGHVIGVLGLAENLIGSKSIRPGDIVSSYSRKTIEILNTDAEGRMILADALTYTEKEWNPSNIICIATLTGSALIALGYDITPLIVTNDNLKKAIEESAKEVDEPVWELPLYEDYCEKIKGTVSDITNSTKNVLIRAGVIMGGAFLKAFIGNTPFAHLDMGGTAWAETADKLCCPIGATGANTMLTIETIKRLTS